MSIAAVVLLAWIQGLAEVLPISRSGHATLARLWLEPGSAVQTLEWVQYLGTAAALCIAVRRRLSVTVSEGVRAIARPTLFRTSPSAHDAAVIFVAAVLSVAVGAALRSSVSAWRGATIAVGLGLLTSALALGSTMLAPRPQLESPTFLGAGVVGIAHGLAIFPGASPIGAALTVMLWMGVKPRRALELAFVVTIPTLAASFLEGLMSGDGGVGVGAIVLGLIATFIGSGVAALALKSLLDRRRLALLGLWLVPLGLASIAYARAVSAAPSINP